MTTEPAATGPSVVLIGGHMTVDDGSVLDSRQPIEGDPASRMTRTSLATSLLWWTTAISLINPVLDSAGAGSFALVLGTRSVVELRHDGSLRRVRLRSMLPGGTTTAEITRTHDETLPAGYEPVPAPSEWYGRVIGTVGVKLGQEGQRWWFLNGNEYYLSHAGPRMGPAVIVDTDDSLMGGDSDQFYASQYEGLEQRRLFGDVVLVMPHTHRAEKLINNYHRWVRGGRPDDTWEPGVGTVEIMPPQPEWDPATPPDPLLYTHPIPVQADFQVTGLSQGGEWRDPSGLEAARALLQARFDLKIGIWDLVRNPLLRSTLLRPEPVPQPPIGPGPIPVSAAQRADRRVAQKMRDRAVEATARVAISKELGPLYRLGWHDTKFGEIRLPLTDSYSRWQDDEPKPLVWLTLNVTKRGTSVTPFAILYNHPDINICAYVTERAHTFRSIANPADFDTQGWRPVLWRETGGWADNLDWSSRARQLAERTGQWKNAFARLCADSIDVLEGRKPYPDRPSEAYRFDVSVPFTVSLSRDQPSATPFAPSVRSGPPSSNPPCGPGSNASTGNQ